MSAYLTGRSAQSGFCSHTCRWNFKVDGKAGAENLEAARALAQSGLLTLEEEQRPGEKFPVFEGDGFTAVLSSKDLRMIEHLGDLRDAGVDSLKIEGRMKSVYYVAMVTRAYRKALDALEGKLSSEEAAPFIAELDNVAHRESTTGFYYNKANADETTTGASDSKYRSACGDPYPGRFSPNEENQRWSWSTFWCVQTHGRRSSCRQTEYRSVCMQPAWCRPDGKPHHSSPQ